MEINRNSDNRSHQPESQIILTEEAQYYLQKAGQWAYFLGIVGFVLAGILY
jgi:hypothetical protein